VIAKGSPAELARDKTAVEVYIQHTVDGLKFTQQQRTEPEEAEPTPVAHAAARTVPAGPSLAEVVLQARLRSLLDRLRTPDFQQAAAELVANGPVAIPTLVEALAWRDAEMRRRVYEVLKHLWPGVLFDPFGADAERHEQLGRLRAALHRRAA
jgi:hypothetical protein